MTSPTSRVIHSSAASLANFPLSPHKFNVVQTWRPLAPGLPAWILKSFHLKYLPIAPFDLPSLAGGDDQQMEIKVALLIILGLAP
jgi:hypothetical protein